MEQAIAKALKGSHEPCKDVLHPISSLLPEGESPWTKEEKQYIFDRLWEESLKMTEWPPCNCG